MPPAERLQPLIDRIVPLAFESGLPALTPLEQTVHHVWSFSGVMLNSGFNGFFVNSYGEFATETVAALREIDAVAFAELLEAAIALFPGGACPVVFEARLAAHESLQDEALATLDHLDDRFYLLDGQDELMNLLLAHYVRHFVDQVGSPVTQGDATIPPRFSRYACGDYFGSPRLVHGVWCATSLVWLILPFERVEERADIAFLVVGRPGVDGIEFGYRKDDKGLWAFHPLDTRFQYLAADAGALVSGWLAGDLRV